LMRSVQKLICILICCDPLLRLVRIAFAVYLCPFVSVDYFLLGGRADVGDALSYSAVRFLTLVDMDIFPHA
jgi:hypothetical protein